MEVHNIPEELIVKPANVEWIKRADVKVEMDAKLVWLPRLLIYYDNKNRLLISSSKKQKGKVIEKEYYSGEMIEHHPKHEKVAQGMSAEDFFNIANEECVRCNDSSVKVTRNPCRLIACTECWEQFMINQPQVEQIRWIKIDSKGLNLNGILKLWKLVPNDKIIRRTCLNLQIDYYVDADPTLRGCPNCGLIAKWTIKSYYNFPCQCGKPVFSCCDKWHPPILCRLLERWTAWRDVCGITETRHPLENADVAMSRFPDKNGVHGPETVRRRGAVINEYGFSEGFNQVYRKYNEMHEASENHKRRARELLESNVGRWKENTLGVNDIFFKQGISTLTISRHFLMNIYVYQFYLEDPANSGVSNGELIDFGERVLLLSAELLPTEPNTGYNLKQILAATERLNEDRKMLLDKIMKNGNFDFNV